MRQAREVMAELAATGLSPDQMVLMMELAASLTAEARPTADASAERRRAKDRERKRTVRGNPRKSAESVESADTAPSFLSLSPTPPNPNQSTPNPPPYSPPALKPDEIWQIAPKIGRERSSRRDLERAFSAALRRGHDPAAILAGVKAYYASDDATRDGGQFAKGVHRVVENDRWQSYAAEARPVDWENMVAAWRATGRWPQSLGPPPDHPETQVPQPLRAA